MTIPKQPVFDVCIIGSGPAGGVLSKELAEAGAKVVLVEAGRKMTAKDFAITLGRTRCRSGA